jgi:hypothetical protein
MLRHYIHLVESTTEQKLYLLCSKDEARKYIKRPPENTEKLSNTPDFQDYDADDEDSIILQFKMHHEKLKFSKVWSGVIDDAFEDEFKSKDGELDEIAIGGLKRCTAVTANAILKHFGKMGITLAQVPETDVGVLQILSKAGLGYKPLPMATGRTLQQFCNLSQRGAFYLVTPGHALALIDGELFDAENRGPDGRKIIEAYAITRN